jgi:hypothetical protein
MGLAAHQMIVVGWMISSIGYAQEPVGRCRLVVVCRGIVVKILMVRMEPMIVVVVFSFNNASSSDFADASVDNTLYRRMIGSIASVIPSFLSFRSGTARVRCFRSTTRDLPALFAAATTSSNCSLQVRAIGVFLQSPPQVFSKTPLNYPNGFLDRVNTVHGFLSRNVYEMA